MLLENDLIAYQTSPLPAGPWLVFAPHPDDESFGMGGSLLLAAQQGIEIFLAFMTDGAQGGDVDSEKLVLIRHQEADRAAKYVNARAVYFWDEPDRKLQLKKSLINKVTELLKEHKPQSVFFPSPMELHPDHRVTSQLVWSGLKQMGSFSGKAYAYDISIQGQINYLIDISTVTAEKNQLMSVYASQLKENNYVEVIESLDRARTYTLGKKVLAAEGFYLFPSLQDDLSAYTLLSLQPYWKENTELKQNGPMVSIIIRTRNRAELLKQAVLSIAEQT